jgi:hypothetical protein
LTRIVGESSRRHDQVSGRVERGGRMDGSARRISFASAKLRQSYKRRRFYRLKSKSISSRENAIESIARMLCAAARAPWLAARAVFELVAKGDSIDV